MTVFLVPLITFLCLPQLYQLLPYSTHPGYDDTKLQRIAVLMDEIYGVLANSTFIPHNAIARGPHTVNTSAISCKPSASVLRLIELLPYVDISLVQEPDWIYGGWFMDYRNPAHLAELCDPLRGKSIGWTDYMEPNDVALTNWGTGGWNNDRTWVMIYNTEWDAIRIFDAELWVQRQGAKREFGGEMEDWWFDDNGQFEWDVVDSAPHVLRAIANKYRTLVWSPWGTSNREDGFGVPTETIKTLLQRNGWPHSFDHTQFNIDFLRTKHRSLGEGVEKQSDFLALQRTHEEARYTNDTGKCIHRQHYEPSNDPDYFEKCMTNKATERKWLDLALEQSRKEALAHCEATGCDPLPFADVFQRARDRIVMLEQEIEERDAELERRDAEALQGQLPEFGTEARDKIEMKNSALANGRWYLLEQIELLKEEMAKLERGETAERGRKWLFDYLRDLDEAWD